MSHVQLASDVGRGHGEGEGLTGCVRVGLEIAAGLPPGRGGAAGDDNRRITEAQSEREIWISVHRPKV